MPGLLITFIVFERQQVRVHMLDLAIIEPDGDESIWTALRPEAAARDCSQAR